MLDFEWTFSLSRFGKQTADNFVHRATRSKMTGFDFPNHMPIAYVIETTDLSSKTEFL